MNKNTFLIVLGFFLVLFYQTVSTKSLRSQISKLNMKKIVHTYIPDHARCAVKMIRRRDASGDILMLDRMNCDWEQL